LVNLVIRLGAPETFLKNHAAPGRDEIFKAVELYLEMPAAAQAIAGSAPKTTR
jgi:hypothetical protein